MAKADLTLERLREVLFYETDTGLFRWLIRCAPWAGPGEIAGSVNKRGYLSIGIDRAVFQSHRLAWFYVTGSWPTGLIDHINQKPGDNRFCNLRDVTNSENLLNRSRANAGNVTGVLGVTRRSSDGRFQAHIGFRGQKKYLGAFDTLDAAIAARLAARLNIG